MMLLYQIVDDLDAGRKSVAENWSPAMTAEGRHVKLARDIEARLRRFWKTFAPFGPPPFRAPYGSEAPFDHALVEAARAEVGFKGRGDLKGSLKRILESDDAFSLFPVEAHSELQRIRHLLVQVVEEGLE